MIIKDGKPHPVAAGFAWGIIGMGLLFFAIPWSIRWVASLFGIAL